MIKFILNQVLLEIGFRWTKFFVIQRLQFLNAWFFLINRRVLNPTFYYNISILIIFSIWFSIIFCEWFRNSKFYKICFSKLFVIFFSIKTSRWNTKFRKTTVVPNLSRVWKEVVLVLTKPKNRKTEKQWTVCREPETIWNKAY